MMFKPRKDTKFSDYIFHGIFFLVYGIFKYFPPPIGNLLRYLILKIFVKKILFSRIGEGVTIYYPYRLKIGSNVTLNEFIYISAFGEIEINKNTRIGAHTIIFSTDHEFKDLNIPIKDQGLVPGKVIIGENVWIGANVTILKGVKIGNNAIIGANSLINKDVPANSIVGGVPAKIIKHRE